MANRRGLTLIELLVVFAIIGILVAILIPAIQYAREASRRADCGNRLRQLAIAVQAYEGTHRFLPPSNSRGGYSFLVVILPQLEMDAVFQKVKFTPGAAREADNPLYKVPVPGFTCPSDGKAQARLRNDANFPTNYQANRGVNTVDCGYNGYFQTFYRGDLGGGYIGLADITDGQSNTAMLSETLLGDARQFPRRVALSTSEFFGKGRYADFLNACKNGPYRASVNGELDIWPTRGAYWNRGSDPDFIYYSHDLPPNSLACMNGGDLFTAALPPNSNHSGGANVVFGDGRLSFIGDGVNPLVWRALGSRNGNEETATLP